VGDGSMTIFGFLCQTPSLDIGLRIVETLFQCSVGCVAVCGSPRMNKLACFEEASRSVKTELRDLLHTTTPAKRIPEYPSEWSCWPLGMEMWGEYLDEGLSWWGSSSDVLPTLLHSLPPALPAMMSESYDGLPPGTCFRQRIVRRK
jgi:hypothetical protein